MVPLIEIIAIFVGFFVLCVILGLVYLLVRKHKTASTIYLIVSAVFLFHALLVFIVIYVPAFPLNILSDMQFF